MSQIHENYSLKNYHTFHIDASARYFVITESIDEIIDFYKNSYQTNLPVCFLGSGSNILFTKDFDGYILKPEIKGIEIIQESNNDILLRVGAGEDWDEFVEYCVNHNYHGIENLSLIPGKVGTCPIQNIGAYGVEVKDVIESVEIIDLITLQRKILKNKDCQFGYRDSIFKRDLKGKILISHVNFKLSKRTQYTINYAGLKDEIEKIGEISLSNVRKAVIDIRNSKLPNTDKIGNAGSFFKNPYISKDHFDKLLKIFPTIPSYPINDELIKIPAGWLIEQSGWKGFRDGDAGVHKDQALVLVNYGNATGEDLYVLSERIKKSILDKFQIQLETEVNIL